MLAPTVYKSLGFKGLGLICLLYWLLFKSVGFKA